MASDLLVHITKSAVAKSSPDGTPYSALSPDHVTRISQALGLEGRTIEIAALENDIIPERYSRNMRTLSPRDQAALLRSQVSVVGLGGLGGGVVEILARLGVGRLVLIDGDRFEESNLNRQFLSTAETVGQFKAEAAVRRVSRINSSVRAEAQAYFLDAHNGVGLLAGSDVIVDCLDSLEARFVLQKAAREVAAPLVSAAVAGVSGHVTVIFPEDRGLELIYGERESLASKGAEAALGTLPQAVTLLSSLECSEVVKVILKKGALLRDKLLVVDLADNTLEVLGLV